MSLFPPPQHPLQVCESIFYPANGLMYDKGGWGDSVCGECVWTRREWRVCAREICVCVCVVYRGEAHRFDVPPWCSCLFGLSVLPFRNIGPSDPPPLPNPSTPSPHWTSLIPVLASWPVFQSPKCLCSSAASKWWAFPLKGREGALGRMCAPPSTPPFPGTAPTEARGQINVGKKTTMAVGWRSHW